MSRAGHLSRSGPRAAPKLGLVALAALAAVVLAPRPGGADIPTPPAFENAR
ncbi:hypothetical protein [Phenylobacterium sp. SCN 70-31]|uniref:hypothetical protein n=1 Tax=Phenylobacterium sp. SCN 70-31 TaxID=1660129 RepID=UPI0025DCB58B|nr:hypothetical protein [Phenylobacterium sp. SCN 70-31]